jgi:hypothetical protein
MNNSSSLGPQKLKLGLLLDSFFIPAWIHHSFERIVNSDYAEISLIVLGKSADKGNQQQDVKDNRSGLTRLYRSIDERIFVRGNSAIALADIRELLKTADIIEVKPVFKGGKCFLETADIEKIQGFGLDILVNSGIDNLQGEVTAAAKYGIWEYFCDTTPPGFWEAMRGLPETRMGLRVLGKANNGGKILFSASSWTYPFSPSRNENRSLWKSSSFLPRQINLLHLLGKDNYFDIIEKYNGSNPLPVQKGRTAIPSGGTQLGLVSKLVFRNLGEAVSRKINQDAWFLMFALDKEDTTPFRDYRRIVPPKGRFFADPHIIRKDDRYYIFIEDFDYKKGKGIISCLTVDQSGNHTSPIPVLEENYHLSYPCVFEWNDHYYMVPESSANRTIDLYECTEFPGKWVHKLTLMDSINAVDNTLLFHNDKWWLFTGVSENEGSSPEVELFIFYSDDLFTNQWQAHLLNPLKSDAKDARPAGKIFHKDGKLFRPSQDCSKFYGYGIDLNEIVVLSENEYKEKTVASIRPDWDKKILATHTYGTEGNLKVIDAYSMRNRFLS